jgi:hypothetical protein
LFELVSRDLRDWIIAPRGVSISDIDEAANVRKIERHRRRAPRNMCAEPAQPGRIPQINGALKDSDYLREQDVGDG